MKTMGTTLGQKVVVLLLVLAFSGCVGYSIHAAYFYYTQWEKAMMQRMSNPYNYYGVPK